jgi:exopolyphosphatase/guanosine-5'-triphosphate,3'-diphosphate pyrophosphatase
MSRRRQDAGRVQELVAVVDLGSTAVRMLLARVTPAARFQILAQERVPTRLGGGVPGTLPGRAVTATLRAVRRFFRRYTAPGSGPRVVAVATSAVRDARNRERLLAPLRYKEGIEVQVLSAHDEARLGVEAALESLPIRNAVVLDLGGSSLQLSRVRNRQVVSSTSVPLGAVRTTRRFLRHDPPSARELRALREEIRAQLRTTLPPATPGEVIVGLGGTVRTIASIHIRGHRDERRHRHGMRMEQADVTAIRERLEHLSPRRRRRVLGVRAERADIIVAGAVVIEEVLVFGGYRALVVCTRGVRDGLLLRETFNGRM